MKVRSLLGAPFRSFMDIIKENFEDYKSSNLFHKKCFDLENEVIELHELAIPFHSVTYEALNYEEFISNNDGRIPNCFRCGNDILQEPGDA